MGIRILSIFSTSGSHFAGTAHISYEEHDASSGSKFDEPIWRYDTLLDRKYV